MTSKSSARTAAVTALLPALTAGVLTVAPAGVAAAADSTVRVSTSPTAVLDATGTSWAASAGFTGGTTGGSATSGLEISGTTDDALYRTERYGMTQFSRPVANGTYDVTLKMAENYWAAAGKRVFDVSAEGKPVLTGVDIYAAVGKNTKYDRTVRVTVGDGTLNLGFVARANYAKVSAIRITPVPTTTVAPTTATTTTPTTSGTASPRRNADNTGVPAGTVLRRYDGNLTITTPGAVYDSLDIHGFVVVKAPNVKITRSIVRGGVGTYSRGLITNTTSTATGLVVEDSDIFPAYPSVWLDGVKGANFTLRRVDVRGTVDNVKVHGPNVVIEDSYLHDSKYYASDPHQGGGETHNDGVQVLGGHNLRIRNNTITGAHNAALQVTQDFSATTDLQFTGNYVDGGGCTVNMAHKKLTYMNGITVSGNRFGRNTRYYDCAIIATRGTTYTATNNVWDATGTAVRLRDGG